jgi:hypothetical protein
MLLKLRAALGAFKLNRWGGGYIVVAGDFLSKDRYGAPTAAERQLGVLHGDSGLRAPGRTRLS